MDSTPTLVCFAVKEEAKFFKSPNCRVLITGMGQKNAIESLQRVLASARPGLVLTCGFAGGLNPGLSLGDIVFQADDSAGLNEKLIDLGAQPGVFHCADRVAITVAEKISLRQSTGADVVEMESSALRALCREKKYPPPPSA